MDNLSHIIRSGTWITYYSPKPDKIREKIFIHLFIGSLMFVVLSKFFRTIFAVLKNRNLQIIFFLVLITFGLGTFGFRYFENQGIENDNKTAIQQYLDDNNLKDNKTNRAIAEVNVELGELYDYHTSFYWTFTTVTTVGFGDFSPVTTWGRILYYAVGMLGISTIGLVIGELGSRLVEVSFMKMRGLKKKKLKDHVILVGWNSTSKVTYEELTSRGLKCVVIDENQDFIEMKDKGIQLIPGSALDTEVLGKADIDTAKTIILPILNDENNVMMSLKAKRLNKNIKVILAVKDEENMDVIEHAGVKSMVPSSKVNGLLLANSVDEKHVVDFIVDVCQETEGLDINQHVVDKPMLVKEIPIGPGDKVITIYKKGKPILNFKNSTKLSKGDWAISLSYHE